MQVKIEIENGIISLTLTPEERMEEAVLDALSHQQPVIIEVIKGDGKATLAPFKFTGKNAS